MGKETVLIADDNESSRLLLKKILKISEYAVLQARNGCQALAIFEKVRPDLMIIDINMPKMGGLELLKKIKEEDGTFPVIVVTGHQYIQEPVLKMADFFMQKPIQPQEVIFNVQKALYGMMDARRVRRHEIGKISAKKKELFPIDPDRLYLYTNIALYAVNEEGEQVEYKKKGEAAGSKEELLKGEFSLFFSADDGKEVAMNSLKACKQELAEEMELLRNGREERINNINAALIRSVYDLFLAPKPEVVKELLDIVDIFLEYPGNIHQLCQAPGGPENNTVTHSVRVMLLMLNYSNKKKMEPSAIRDYGFSGLMHDLGLMTVNKKVLAARPLKNEASERDSLEYRMHPVNSVRLLEEVKFDNMAVKRAILEHHERVDGKGYPSRKKNISDIGKLLRLVDNYELLEAHARIVSGKSASGEIIKHLKENLADYGVFDEDLLREFEKSLVD